MITKGFNKQKAEVINAFTDLLNLCTERWSHHGYPHTTEEYHECRELSEILHTMLFVKMGTILKEQNKKGIYEVVRNELHSKQK